MHNALCAPTRDGSERSHLWAALFLTRATGILQTLQVHVYWLLHGLKYQNSNLASTRVLLFYASDGPINNHAGGTLGSIAIMHPFDHVDQLVLHLLHPHLTDESSCGVIWSSKVHGGSLGGGGPA